MNSDHEMLDNEAAGQTDITQQLTSGWSNEWELVSQACLTALSAWVLARDCFKQCTTAIAMTIITLSQYDMLSKYLG